jgi:hypothetical protein
MIYMKKMSHSKPTVTKTAQKVMHKTAAPKTSYDPLNTITPTSRMLALLVFGTFAVITFFLGMRYQEAVSKTEAAFEQSMKYEAMPRKFELATGSATVEKMEPKDTMMMKK